MCYELLRWQMAKFTGIKPVISNFNSKRINYLPHQKSPAPCGGSFFFKWDRKNFAARLVPPAATSNLFATENTPHLIFILNPALSMNIMNIKAWIKRFGTLRAKILKPGSRRWITLINIYSLKPFHRCKVCCLHFRERIWIWLRFNFIRSDWSKISEL